MNEYEPLRQWDRRAQVGVGLTVVSAVTLIAFAVVACGPSAPAAPTAAAIATQPIATAGAAVAPTVSSAATSAVSTVAAAATAVSPTVSAAATALEPSANAAAATAEAIGTKTAPTVAAAATALAPTAAAAATAAVGAAGTATATTAGQLADAGQSVYGNTCAVCHGAQGEGKIGPALWGPNANYGTFASAQDLLTFIAYRMPLTHPGSLTPEQAMDVTAYLLVQDGLVQRNASLSSAGFGGIQLKK